jgi:hypothetical protein
VIEKRELLIGKDAESISASNKIRLLLSQVQNTAEVPEAFSDLKSFMTDSIDIPDAVEALVQIRNEIVHSQEAKRKKLANINWKVKYQLRELSIWYIEHALLSTLDFKGKYYNRCSGSKWAGQGGGCPKPS